MNTNLSPIEKKDIRYAHASRNLLEVTASVLDELLANGTDLGDLTEVIRNIQALSKEMTDIHSIHYGAEKSTMNRIGDLYEDTFSHLFRD
jgi:hypothetical protein